MLNLIGFIQFLNIFTLICIAIDVKYPAFYQSPICEQKYIYILWSYLDFSSIIPKAMHFQYSFASVN